MSTPTIPVVDLRDYTGQDPEARVEFIQSLGTALEELGFVAVSHHGIPGLERSCALARELFALPLEVKRRYETPEDGRQRGYTSFGVEHARDQALPDLKEFWHFGRTLPPGHPRFLDRLIPPNRSPRELPEVEAHFTALFNELESFAEGLLEAVGEYLEYPPGFLRSLVTGGNSVLRLIHYPDPDGRAAPGAVRAAAHEDINLLTVLPAATAPGLELLTRDGVWMPVQTPPDVVVCDTGDMMALLTGGRLPATTHRVVNPATSDGGRLSMPFFLHPRPEVNLRPFAPRRDGEVLAGEFFHNRLREIGVEPARA